ERDVNGSPAAARGGGPRAQRRAAARTRVGPTSCGGGAPRGARPRRRGLGASEERSAAQPREHRTGPQLHLTRPTRRLFPSPMAAPPTRPVAGVIVAGGRASRMGGRDKAVAAADAEPIAVRTVRMFRALFPQVLVAPNRPERFAGLGVETVADVFPDGGPLAGMHAALRASRHPHAFVAACDMPGLDPDVIR